MSLYIGLMSGTSLDGVDGVLSSIPDEYDGGEIGILETAHVPFDGPLRQQLMSLQLPGHNEIEKKRLPPTGSLSCMPNAFIRCFRKKASPRKMYGLSALMAKLSVTAQNSVLHARPITRLFLPNSRR